VQKPKGSPNKSKGKNEEEFYFIKPPQPLVKDNLQLARQGGDLSIP